MKAVLVTGAGGYLGIPLCAALVEKGYRVHALDRYFFGREKIAPLNDHPGLDVLVEDLRHFDTALLQDVDAVIDLAGLSNDASAEIDPRLTAEINVDGAVRLARAAKAAGVRRYVYSSSASVYGAGARTGLAESDECRPQTDYARSKLALEDELGRLAGDGFEVVIFRNATVFGMAPRMRFDLAINIMTLRAWRERVVYVMGGGEQWRPFVHVSDVVRAFLLGLELPAEQVAGEVFNVGADDMNYRIKQLAQFVVDVIPNVRIHNIPDDPDKRTYNLSFTKIRDALDFVPQVRVHEGVVEIKQALERGVVDGDDPTCHTLNWYRSLIEWNERIQELTHRGILL